MSWKSKTIISILSKISPFMLKYKKDNTKLLILAYHRILKKADNYPLDDEVISNSPEIFEKEMQFCKENFSLINFQHLKRYIEKGINLPQNPLIVTFDDGYSDNFNNVFPILQKYDIPATIFLTVDYIDTNRLFWWDEVNFYMKNCNKKRKDISAFLHLLKSIPNGERIEKIRQLKNAMRINTANIIRQTLNWKEIKEMSDKGIEFGSHTMTHPILSKLEYEKEIEFELKESKKIIENKLGKEVIVFSYPVGGKNSYNEKIKKSVRETGYSFAVTYMHGVNHINNGLVSYELKRLRLDQVNLARFKVTLTLPGLFK